MAFLVVQQVIGAETEVEDVPGLHAVRVVIAVAGARGGQSQQRGGDLAIAGEADGFLLVGRQVFDRVGRVGDAADDQAAVVAPGERNPFGVVRPLVAGVHGGLEGLIVIDAEDAAANRSALGDQATRFRREVTRAGVAEVPVSAEAVNVGGGDAAGEAIDFRIVPGDRERDGGVEQGAEIVGVVGELPEVIDIDEQEFVDGLLKAGVELVAEAGLNGYGVGGENVARETADTGGIGQHQILVEGRLHRA